MAVFRVSGSPRKIIDMEHGFRIVKFVHLHPFGIPCSVFDILIFAPDEATEGYQ